MPLLVSSASLLTFTNRVVVILPDRQIKKQTDKRTNDNENSTYSFGDWLLFSRRY